MCVHVMDISVSANAVGYSFFNIYFRIQIFVSKYSCASHVICIYAKIFDMQNSWYIQTCKIAVIDSSVCYVIVYWYLWIYVICYCMEFGCSLKSQNTIAMHFSWFSLQNYTSNVYLQSQMQFSHTTENEKKIFAVSGLIYTMLDET